MFIDTHVHTNRHSACSILSPSELLHRAAETGLSGIVITEHDYVWWPEEIEDLKKECGTDLLILRGQEIHSSVGHLLIFGFYGSIPNNLSVEKVIDTVHANGGIVILAHPFRSGNNLGEKPELLRRLFSPFDGIEAYNGNQNWAENEFGANMQKALGIAGTGGSDAHSAATVGRFVTHFRNSIANEADMIQEIRNGRCTPIAWYERNAGAVKREIRKPGFFSFFS